MISFTTFTRGVLLGFHVSFRGGGWRCCVQIVGLILWQICSTQVVQVQEPPELVSCFEPFWISFLLGGNLSQKKDAKSIVCNHGVAKSGRHIP